MFGIDPNITAVSSANLLSDLTARRREVEQSRQADREYKLRKKSQEQELQFAQEKFDKQLELEQQQMAQQEMLGLAYEQGRMERAQLGEVGALQRAEIGEAGALERLQLGERESMARLEEQQAGALERAEIGEAGALERGQLGVEERQLAEAGALERLTYTQEQAMERLELGEEEAMKRLRITEKGKEEREKFRAQELATKAEQALDKAETSWTNTKMEKYELSDAPTGSASEVRLESPTGVIYYGRKRTSEEERRKKDLLRQHRRGDLAYGDRDEFEKYYPWEKEKRVRSEDKTIGLVLNLIPKPKVKGGEIPKVNQRTADKLNRVLPDYNALALERGLPQVEVVLTSSKWKKGAWYEVRKVINIGSYEGAVIE